MISCRVVLIPFSQSEKEQIIMHDVMATDFETYAEFTLEQFIEISTFIEKELHKPFFAQFQTDVKDINELWQFLF